MNVVHPEHGRAGETGLAGSPTRVCARERGEDRCDRPVVVEMRGITKLFPGVRANDGVDFVVRRGEVHCLLGENGAGKSTLMDVLAGIYQPDEGSIRVCGNEVRIASPRDAIDLGIGMVHQHGSLIPAFTVLENLMLGQGEGVRLGVKKAREDLTRLSTMLGVEVEPDTEVQRLSLGQQQQVEILKALWRDPKVLILDEPTSMLTSKGSADLERVIVQLKQNGLAIVFITHKLREAFAIGDRVSVLRQGRLEGVVEYEAMRDATPEDLQRTVVGMMFPDEAAGLVDAAAFQDASRLSSRTCRAEVGRPLLELERVRVQGRRGEVGVEEEIDLTVHAGEVVGIAGVDGNGQQPLAEAIAGQRKLAGGDIRLDGVSVGTLSIGARQRRGLRYVTDDRVNEGIVGALSVAVNMVSKRIGMPPFWANGRVQMKAIEANADRLVREYDIMTPTVDSPAGSLSGGNVQKVVLARELSFDPKIVVFSKPTHGLDVKTAKAVRARIRQLVHKGAAGALVISTDIEELLALCDRVVVLSRGRVTGVVQNKPGAEQKIGALMVGERGGD